MTSHETAIAERLHDDAGRIPVDTSEMPAIETGRAMVAFRSSPRRRPGSVSHRAGSTHSGSGAVDG